MNAQNVHIFCMVDPLLLLVGVRLRDSLVEAIVHQDLDDHTVPDLVLEHDLWHGVACCCVDTGSGVNTGMVLTAVMQYAIQASRYCSPVTFHSSGCSSMRIAPFRGTLGVLSVQ